MAARTPEALRDRSGEWRFPPSPSTLEMLYLNLREHYDEVKKEIKQLFRRQIVDVQDNYVKDIVLEELPLLKFYEIYLEVIQEMKEEAPPINNMESARNIGFDNEDDSWEDAYEDEGHQPAGGQSPVAPGIPPPVV